MEFHTVLSLCRPENKNRWLYKEPLKKQINLNKKSLNNISREEKEEPLDMKCSKCNFQSQNGDLLATHLASEPGCFGAQGLIIRKTKEEKKITPNNPEMQEEWYQIEDKMVEIFGLKLLANIDPVKMEEERKLEQVLKREFLINSSKTETDCLNSKKRNSSSKSRSPPLKLTNEEIKKDEKFKEIEKELEQIIPPIKIPIAIENSKLISLLLQNKIKSHEEKTRNELEIIALR